VNNRIDAKFSVLRRNKKKAFIVFITAGDPNLAVTEKLIYAFDRIGVDIIELGVPFSDPLADGPTIQAASERSLKHHVSLEKILQLVKKVRKRTDIPIVLMTYYNPVFHYGEESFIKKTSQCGVDGLIVPDLPPEEGETLIRLAKGSGLATIFFLSPTTTAQRIQSVVKKSTGFIYFVSLTGVTGARTQIPKEIAVQVKKAKRYTSKPICVGFGISTPAQVKSVGRIADGVIIGSAIVNAIKKNRGKKTLVRNVSRFVSGLKGAV